MEIIRLLTQELITRQEFEQSFQNSGSEFKLPADIRGLDLSEFGVAAVVQTPKPPEEFGKDWEVTGAENHSGVWHLRWSQINLPIEQVRANMPSLTPLQFRLGLIRNGFSMSDIDEAIASYTIPQEREEAKAHWEYASSFERTHLFVVVLSSSMGIPPEMVDAMWMQAAAL